MTQQTLVAVYDTAAHADAAVRDLEAAHVPSSAIGKHRASEDVWRLASVEVSHERR